MKKLDLQKHLFTEVEKITDLLISEEELQFMTVLLKKDELLLVLEFMTRLNEAVDFKKGEQK